MTQVLANGGETCVVEEAGSAITPGADNGALSQLVLKGGAQVRTRFGDRDISGTLLAQNITFDPGGERTVTGAFVGLSAEHVSAGGMAFHAAAEGLIEG